MISGEPFDADADADANDGSGNMLVLSCSVVIGTWLITSALLTSLVVMSSRAGRR